jgi:hypothetical protein
MITAKELTRSLTRYARRNGLKLTILKDRGKGGHRLIVLGDKEAALPWNSKDLCSGTLHAILRQLNVKLKDH